MLPLLMINSSIALLALCPVLSLIQSRLGFTACIVLIVAMMSAKVANDWNYYILPQSDFYSILAVGRHSSPLEIRHAFKKISLKLHPDKNPSKDAEVLFQKVKLSYDVLMDEKNRDIFNRFGYSAVGSDPRVDELKLISDTGVIYLMWGLATYFTTLTSGSKLARTWIILFLIIVLVAHVSFTLTEASFPLWFPAFLTEFELVMLLQSVFPGVLLLFRSLAEYLYVDSNKITSEAITHIKSNQSALSELLGEIEQLVASEETTSDHHAQDLQMKVAAVRNQLIQSDEQALMALDTLKKSSSSPGSSYYWLIFVVIYGGVYLFQQE